MTRHFIPDNFVVPVQFETPDFILRKLTTGDVEQDFDAVMSSKESLRQIFGPNDTWPSDEMTLEDNYKDLQEHESDFDQRAGFTYTVIESDEQFCLGCVYIYPSPPKQYDVRVYYWVRDSAKSQGLEEKLGDFLHHWLADVWPFRSPAFPGREIPWKEWEVLMSRQVVDSWFDAFRKKDISLLKLAEDFVHTSPFGEIKGRDAYLAIVQENPEAFFRPTIEVVDILEDGHKFAVRYLLDGNPSCDCIYVRNGQIAEIYSYYHYGDKPTF